MSGGFGFEFLAPVWLSGVLLLPLLAWVTRRSLADLPRRQMRVSLAVRCVIIVLLLLALAGLNVLRQSHRTFVVLAMDESLSVDGDGRRAAADFIRSAVADGTHNVAVLPFHAQPQAMIVGKAAIHGWLSALQVSQPNTAAAPDSELPETAAGNDAGAAVTSTAAAGMAIAADDPRTATDLSAAVRAAVHHVPAGRVPHVVLLTDGLETIGDVAAMVSRSQCPVSAVPLPTRKDPELQVSEVVVPAEVAEGQPFRLEAVIDANHDDRIIVDVFAGDFRAASEVHDVTAGENRFLFDQQIRQPTEFTVRIRPPDDAVGTEADSQNYAAAAFMDSIAENNQASGIVHTSGQPRVLMVSPAEEQNRSLAWAMKEQGIGLEFRAAAGLPEELNELQPYSAVILSDVAATD
ncbi:MAG: hypothetical protein KDA89_04790, partial [Planctomycetaceae bacterium]|nr:hypothetical protein [Planctomycetaceae bacterium]